MTKTIGGESNMDLNQLRIKLEFYQPRHKSAPQPIALVAFIKTEDGFEEQWGKITTNVPEVILEPNEFICKNYSENASWAEQYLKAHPEFFLPTTKQAQVGAYTTCPIYRVTKEFIATHFERTYDSKTDIYEAPPQLWKLYDAYCK